MGSERIDPETLAALLDGRLEGAERERVLRSIAENPDDYQTFADAAYVTAELDRKAATATPILRVRPRPRWLMVAAPAAIAAGLTALAVGVFRGREFSPTDLVRSLQVVTTPGNRSLAMRLGENWDQPGWSVTRGERPDVIEPAQAFRLGARATDVEIAVRAQDTTALRLVAADLIQLASGIDGGGPAAVMYQQVIDQGVLHESSARKDASNALSALMGDSPWFELGVWAEAARIASSAGQVGFLRDNARTLDRLIERLRALPSVEVPELMNALESLLEDLRSDALLEAGFVSQRLRQVMALAGR